MALKECNEFQDIVSKYSVRHKSILDILSKTQESNSKINRALIKSVINCGCIKIEADKISWPTDASLSEVSSYLDSHVQGELCADCKEIVTEEIGKLLFYISALCNTTSIHLSDVLEKEQKKIEMLGKFNLT